MMHRVVRKLCIFGAISLCGWGWSEGHTTPEDVQLITPLVIEQPTQCMNGGWYVSSELPPGWTCGPVRIGGYLPGDGVCIPKRGCFTLTQEVYDLVAKYFQPADQRWAIRSNACESEFRAEADNGHGYGGYWQHRIKSFPKREAAAIKWWAARGVAWTGRGVFNGESNAATTAFWLDATSRSQWSCSGAG